MLRGLLFLLLLTVQGLKAQEKLTNFDIGSYRHRISYADYEVVFQAQPLGKKLKAIDSQKKYYWFANNQIQGTQGGYSGKLLHGLYTAFYLNKNLKEQGMYVHGLKEGSWKSWNEDGTLAFEINYKVGIAEGKYHVYDKTGRLIETGKNRDGKLDGLQKKFITPDSVVVLKFKAGMVLNRSKNWLKNLFVKN
jgi:hypothetical protein